MYLFLFYIFFKDTIYLFTAKKNEKQKITQTQANPYLIEQYSVETQIKK